jgi:hypothetical protein
MLAKAWGTEQAIMDYYGCRDNDQSNRQHKKYAKLSTSIWRSFLYTTSNSFHMLSICFSSFCETK